MRALLSVYDKTGLVGLASGLSELGWDLVASGGTADALSKARIAHSEVPELTGIPEMLGGRVKTLHPAVHGGILADRSKPEHLADLESQGIVPIDLVVCNLYPFGSNPSVEMIDVGGPTMVRAAAKNHEHVGIVVDPSDYEGVLSELRTRGELSPDTRRRLARAAFAHTTAYDAAIVEWFDAGQPGSAPSATGSEQGASAAPASEELPPTIHLSLQRAEELRYGENPHQHGARYRVLGQRTWWDEVVQHAGTRLSYLNLFDADAAWRLVHDLSALPESTASAGSAGPAPEAAAAIVKHSNPCGAAVAGDLATAFRRALECDPVSAFGGVVALGGTCTEEVAAAVTEGPQADVIVASGWVPEAVEILIAKRKATRLLEAPLSLTARTGRSALELRSLGGGYLVQEPDHFHSGRGEWQVATKAVPDPEQWLDLELAWRVCARTTSNSVVVAHSLQAIGVGAGQQSRVEAARIAVSKAAGRSEGASAASDAFFPFRDGLDVLADAGVRCVIQPGGSVKDPDVIAAADERGVAMVLTGERHFRH